MMTPFPFSTNIATLPRKVDAVVSSNIGADSGVEICELKVVTDGVSADADGETALTN